MKRYINTREARNGVVMTLEEFNSSDYPKWIDFGRALNESLQKYQREGKSVYISQRASVAWASQGIDFGGAVDEKKKEGDKVYEFQIEYSDSPKMDYTLFTRKGLQCISPSLKDAYDRAVFCADDDFLKSLYGEYYRIIFTGVGGRMSKYYIQSGQGFWELTAARTVTGAKQEAIKRFSGGFTGELMQVAEGDNVEEQRHVLSTKYNLVGAKWHDVI